MFFVLDVRCSEFILHSFGGVNVECSNNLVIVPWSLVIYLVHLCSLFWLLAIGLVRHLCGGFSTVSHLAYLHVKFIAN